MGWGTLVWRVAGRPVIFRQLNWLWCLLAGFCAHALVLQNLVYLGVPLKYSAWPALVAGIIAVGFTIGPVVAAWRKTTRGARRDARALLATFGVTSFVLLGFVLRSGPAHEFGRARYDQANYVATAQFLAEKSFSTTTAEIGLHPWISRAIEAKEQRITQSIAHGALAVISGHDAQIAYGAIAAFFTALIAIAVAGWLRRLGVPRGIASLGGWAGAMGPAVTFILLEGFFSQLASLFVLPALAGVLVRRAPLARWPRLAAGLLLAFWIGTYSESAIVGVAAVVALRAAARGAWRDRAADAVWIGAIALLANPGYTMRLPQFLWSQQQGAFAPGHLAELMPNVLTWRGWGQLWFDFGDASVSTLRVVAGAAALLCIIAALAVPRPGRSRVIALLAFPLVALLFLAMQPVFPQYAVGKLAAGFAPIWVGATLLGLLAIAPRGSARWIALTATACGAIVISLGGVRALARVEHSNPALGVLTSAGMDRARQEVQEHPERTYLVANDDPLLTQWLCFFGRDAQVYVDRRHVGDRVAPSEANAFRRLPPRSGDGRAPVLWWLDPERTGKAAGYSPAWDLHVAGAVEQREDEHGQYYVLRGKTGLSVIRASSSNAPETRWLDLVAIPFPSRAPVQVELIAPDGSRQVVTLTTARALRFRLTTAPGSQTFTLQTTTASTAIAPGDVIVQALSLDPVVALQPASDPPPAEEIPRAR